MQIILRIVVNITYKKNDRIKLNEIKHVLNE